MTKFKYGDLIRKVREPESQEAVQPKDQTTIKPNKQTEEAELQTSSRIANQQP